MAFQHVLERELAGAFGFAAHGDGPRRRLEAPGVGSGRALVDTEFVEVVVRGDVFVAVRRFGGAVLLVALEVQRREVGARGFRPGAAQAGDACSERCLEQPTAVEIDRFGRDFRRPDLRRVAGSGLSDQHALGSWTLIEAKLPPLPYARQRLTDS